MVAPLTVQVVLEIVQKQLATHLAVVDNLVKREASMGEDDPTGESANKLAKEALMACIAEVSEAISMTQEKEAKKSEDVIPDTPRGGPGVR